MIRAHQRNDMSAGTYYSMLKIESSNEVTTGLFYPLF